jgi:hypothetical protein
MPIFLKQRLCWFLKKTRMSRTALFLEICGGWVPPHVLYNLKNMWWRGARLTLTGPPEGGPSQHGKVNVDFIMFYGFRSPGRRSAKRDPHPIKEYLAMLALSLNRP